MLLMRPGEQAWLLSGRDGNHEFTRAFFCAVKDDPEARYIVKDGNSRLGRSNLVGITVEGEGAYFSWDCGRTTFVPANMYQMTYRSTSQV